MTNGSDVNVWIKVGSLTDIPKLGSRVVRRPEGDIAVFRMADDSIYAVADKCPHRGGPLSQGIVFNGRVACPLHDWVIDLKTGSAVSPDIGCAPTYVTRVEHGVVWLSLALENLLEGCAATA